MFCSCLIYFEWNHCRQAFLVDAVREVDLAHRNALESAACGLLPSPLWDQGRFRNMLVGRSRLTSTLGQPAGVVNLDMGWT